MPWWAIVYLVAIFLLTIGAVHDDLDKENSKFFVSGSLASCLFIFSFVWAFFVPEVGIFLGSLVFPMLFLGIAFEFYSTHLDLKEHQDLSSKVQFFVVLVVNLLVVPGYVFGFIVGLRHANV